MLGREVREFVKVALAMQKKERCSMDQAKAYAATWLEVEIPTDAEFSQALIEGPARKRRGRPPRELLSKSHAIAAVATYFESIGAGKEQAIAEAQRRLRITISRRVAKDAVASFKAQFPDPSQIEFEAVWAYATFNTGTTLPLPSAIRKVRRKRTKGKLI